ncbi:MAG: adenylate/guanylate cyclase domain-containing protein [Rhodospirillaceae bacterium]
MRRFLTEFALLVAIVVFTLTLPRFFVPLKAIENWVTDLFTVFSSPLEPPDQNVVVLTLTEDTLAQFPYRSPVDRSFLADLLRHIDRVGARAVGFDVLLDQPTEPDKDAALAAAFRDVHLPVVVAWGDAGAGLTEAQSAYLAAYTQPVRTGRANLGKDDSDGTVRDMLAPEGGRASLPGAVAQALGVRLPTNEVPIVYRRSLDAGTLAIPVYPAHLAAMLPPEWLRGKAVLVGSDLPQEDRHRTPFASAFGNREGTIPGVFIHAFALAQLLDGRVRPAWSEAEAVLLTTATVAAGLVIAALSLPLAAVAGLGLVVLAVPWAGGFALAVLGGPVAAPLSPSLALVLALGLGSALTGRRRFAEKKFIESAFQRYVSPAVLAEIQADPSKLRLGGERRDLTFVFTDIAGFTTFSESQPPDVVANLLNQYLDGMSGIVLAHKGTIDKYIGDAVVSLFGAPVAHDDDPDRAVACAIEMDAFASGFCATHRDVAFGITRIGVNSGPAVVGNFGGSDRFDYTAIGDTVNTAARLEGVNKYLGTRIAVGGEAVARCRAHRFLPVAEVVLKGKLEPIAVFTPVVQGDDEAYVSAYIEVYALLHDGGADAADLATARFAAMDAIWPDQSLIILHRRRLAAGQTGTVMVMSDK